MKITRITKENLDYFKNFISAEDEKFIKEDLKILPIGLVADDYDGDVNLAAGAICARPDDFMLNITSFYISPEYRGRGGGKFLLDEVKRIFGEEDMEFNVEFFVYGKEEEDFANFLEEYGFMEADPEYSCYMSTVAQLKESQLFDKKGIGDSFRAIDSKILKAADKEIAKTSAMTPLDGFLSPRIEKDVSVGVVNAGSLESFLVFETGAKDSLLLTAVYAKDKSPITLLHMMEKSTELLLKKYPDNMKILIQSVEDVGEDLIQNIFKDVKEISCRYRYVI